MKKSIFIYIFILEFKIGFSSEVSLMYNGKRGFKGEARGKKIRKITLTEVRQCAVCGAVHVLQENH